MRKVILLGITLLALLLALPAIALAASGHALPGFSLGGGAAQDTPAGDETETNPWVGVTLVPHSERMAERLGFVEDADGLVIMRVKSESPAAQAGLQKGDLLVSIGSVAMEEPGDAKELVAASAPGDTLIFTVQRAGSDESQDIDVVVGERPERDGAHPQRSRLLYLAAALQPNLQSAQLNLLDDDGNSVSISLVAGAVSGEPGADTLTVSPSDGSTDLSLTLTDDSPILRRGKKLQAEDLEDGQEVLVVMRDGALEAVLVKSPRGDSPRGDGGGRHHRSSASTQASGDGSPAASPTLRFGRGGGFQGGAPLRAGPRGTERGPIPSSA